MITQEGDYYICEGKSDSPEENRVNSKATEQVLEAKGDIKERLALIKQRISVLKEEKEKQAQQKSNSSWLQQYSEPLVEPSKF